MLLSRGRDQIDEGRLLFPIQVSFFLIIILSAIIFIQGLILIVPKYIAFLMPTFKYVLNQRLRYSVNSKNLSLTEDCY